MQEPKNYHATLDERAVVLSFNDSKGIRKTFFWQVSFVVACFTCGLVLGWRRETALGDLTTQRVLRESPWNAPTQSV